MPCLRHILTTTAIASLKNVTYEAYLSRELRIKENDSIIRFECIPPTMYTSLETVVAANTFLLKHLP